MDIKKELKTQQKLIDYHNKNQSIMILIF